MRLPILFANLACAALSAQTPIHIGTIEPRPLEAALDKLEETLGVPMNYEDPRFACSSEIHDVTAQVQSAAQRAANPNVRIIVPKGGAISFDSVLPSTPQAGDALGAVTQLRIQYEAKGYPGRFTVKQVGSVLTVEPSAARGSDCAWAAATPAMETKISFPTQTRDATETLLLILSSLTQHLGIKVGLGNLPILAFVKRSVMVGANEEPANVVLVRLFELLSPFGGSSYSYHLFYDPGLKYYLADISAVQPVRAKAPSQAAAPPPPAGVFGAKPAKQ